jgi:hypothetical protein
MMFSGVLCDLRFAIFSRKALFEPPVSGFVQVPFTVSLQCKWLFVNDEAAQRFTRRIVAQFGWFTGRFPAHPYRS